MSRLLRKRGHQPAKTGVSALMPAGPSSANAIQPTREITMRARSGCEVINQDRRQLLSTAAMGIAAAGAASFFPAYPAPAATSDDIRPFRVNVPEEQLVDLRRRIAATRWPDRETDASSASVGTARRAPKKHGLGAPVPTGGGLTEPTPSDT